MVLREQQPMILRAANAAIVRVAPSLLWLALATAAPAYDIHFDYTSFDNPNTPGIDPHFGQAQFNVLNYPSINGNYMMTSTDNHRPEMVANNNALAEFYNWLEQPTMTAHTTKDGHRSEPTRSTPTSSAIRHTTGPGRTGLILNEMSSSLWPNPGIPVLSVPHMGHRRGTRLHDTYGYKVVTYSLRLPILRRLCQRLAGARREVVHRHRELSERRRSMEQRHRLRVALCLGPGAVSTGRRPPIGNLGVASSRLFLSEHFAQHGLLASPGVARGFLPPTGTPSSRSARTPSTTSTSRVPRLHLGRQRHGHH